MLEVVLGRVVVVRGDDDGWWWVVAEGTPRACWTTHRIIHPYAHPMAHCQVRARPEHAGRGQGPGLPNGSEA